MGSPYFALSPDARLVATTDRTLKDPETTEKLWNIDLLTTNRVLKVAGIGAVKAFSTDGLAFWFVRPQGAALIDSVTGQEKRFYAYPTNATELAFALSPDGESFTAGLENTEAAVFNVRSGAERFRLKGHKAIRRCFDVTIARLARYQSLCDDELELGTEPRHRAGSNVVQCQWPPRRQCRSQQWRPPWDRARITADSNPQIPVSNTTATLWANRRLTPSSDAFLVF